MALYQGLSDLRNIDDCEKFYNDLIKLIDENNDVSVDFTNIKYISSTGIGKLMKINDELKKLNKNIKVINISGGMRRILTQIDAIDLLTNFTFE